MNEEFCELKKQMSVVVRVVEDLANRVQEDNKCINGRMEQLLEKMNELVERGTRVEDGQAAAVRQSTTDESPQPSPSRRARRGRSGSWSSAQDRQDREGGETSARQHVSRPCKWHGQGNCRRRFQGVDPVWGLLEIRNAADGNLNRWWNQLSSCLLFLQAGKADALWSKVEEHLANKELSVHWRANASNMSQRQFYMVCNRCKDATVLTYGCDKVQEQFEDLERFLGLDKIPQAPQRY